VTRLLAALGGPRHRVSYPNGDQTAYVSVVYEATVVGGNLRPDLEETSEVGWFRLDALPSLELGVMARATLDELGWLPPHGQ
jgi:hypothetical protein